MGHEIGYIVKFPDVIITQTDFKRKKISFLIYMQNDSLQLGKLCLQLWGGSEH